MSEINTKKIKMDDFTFFIYNEENKLRAVAFSRAMARALFERAKGMYGEKLHCTLIREWSE